ncbi:TauD/TfdA family dioxygenase [Kiloniella laminariae]|uniref:TauD/TfdA family dioxygenase n=1 Tax=Kiloniella laminariae TaxID=454162 RepID=UPI00035C4F8C|nr:TauD/TfdA family dioxygenase [Kiloniella laminariae]
MNSAAPLTCSSMTIESLEQTGHALKIVWADGRKATYHYLWLRDNCPSGFHPSTEERLFNLTSVSAGIHAIASSFDEEHLYVSWSEEAHKSVYRLQWLYDHAYSPDFKSAPGKWAEPWGVEMRDRIYEIQYEDLMRDDRVLFDWLKAVKRDGISYVRNVPCNDQGITDVAQRIAFLRETNFGKIFNVRSVANPINNAYTSEGLPLHIDLINQEIPPGFQFLHCLVNDSRGGESTYADGFRIIEELKATDPEAFKLLSSVTVPMRFHDSETDIRSRHPIINVDENGHLVELRYSPHLVDTFDMDEDIMESFYLAFRRLMVLINDSRFVISIKMKSGDLCIFDNRRVMHGRNAFDATGARHLRGCYVDRSDFDSRLRVLSKRYGETISGL